MKAEFYNGKCQATLIIGKATRLSYDDEFIYKVQEMYLHTLMKSK